MNQSEKRKITIKLSLLIIGTYIYYSYVSIKTLRLESLTFLDYIHSVMMFSIIGSLIISIAFCTVFYFINKYKNILKISVLAFINFFIYY